jgi:hypothetical protein
VFSLKFSVSREEEERFTAKAQRSPRNAEKEEILDIGEEEEEVRGQRSEVRGQRSEVRGQRSEVRGQRGR